MFCGACCLTPVDDARPVMLLRYGEAPTLLPAASCRRLRAQRLLRKISALHYILYSNMVLWPVD
jgi:hypothetical protein